MSPYITTKNKYTAERSRNSVVNHPQLLAAANSMLLMLAILVAVSYLVMLNSVVANGYAVKSLDKELRAEKREEERLAALVAQSQTPAALRGKTGELGLVAIDGASYPKTEAAVALGNSVR